MKKRLKKKRSKLRLRMRPRSICRHCESVLFSFAILPKQVDRSKKKGDESGGRGAELLAETASWALPQKAAVRIRCLCPCLLLSSDCGRERLDRDVPSLFSLSLILFLDWLLLSFSLLPFSLSPPPPKNGRREKQPQAEQRHEPQGLEHRGARGVGPARRVSVEAGCFSI